MKSLCNSVPVTTNATEIQDGFDDSLVDEVQELLLSSDSEFDWLDDEMPLPKKK